ncbi:MAG: transposase, partial [Chloroflexi bacterium]|nr:transposase [Chloroflexota bacterium]
MADVSSVYAPGEGHVDVWFILLGFPWGTIMRQRYSAEQWADWIAEQSESGVTISDFCDSVGVSENSFYVWRRKLRSASTGGVCSEAGLSAGFIELAVTESRSAGRVEIELPCGALVRVPGEESLIRSVLVVLLDAGVELAGGSSCFVLELLAGLVADERHRL